MTIEHSGAGDISRSLALMWEFDEKPSRGPKPQLSLGRIVDLAISIADAEGIEAVSMRRVAADLGVGTMSLYRYVPGKEELLDLMLERVAAVEDGESFPTTWRAGMEALGRGLWQLYLTHPWLPFVDQTRPLLGPNSLKGMEIALGAFEDTSLSDQQKVGVITIIDNFVQSAARAHNSATLAEKRTGVTNEEFWQAQEPVLIAAMETGRYPRLAGLDDQAFAASGEDVFELALAITLDGIAALVARH